MLHMFYNRRVLMSYWMILTGKIAISNAEQSYFAARVSAN